MFFRCVIVFRLFQSSASPLQFKQLFENGYLINRHGLTNINDLSLKMLPEMAGNFIASSIRALRHPSIRRRAYNFRKITKNSWKRWMAAGGLTTSTLSLSVRLMMPPTFEHDATKLQLGAMQTTSHEQLIRQASTMTVDAATQLLSQTVVAYIEMSHLYREVLRELMDVLSDDLQLVSLENVSEDNASAVDLSQELWEQEMDARQRASALRNSLLELSSYMDYVTKVATASAEASYLAGSDFASTSMCERLNSAHRAFEEEKAKNKEADRELLRMQESHATLGAAAGAAGCKSSSSSASDEASSSLAAAVSRRKLSSRASGIDMALLDPLGPDVDSSNTKGDGSNGAKGSADATSESNKKTEQ